MEDIRKHKIKILKAELAQSSRTSSIASSCLIGLYIFALSAIDSEMGYSYYFFAILIAGQVWRYFQSFQKNVEDRKWLNTYTAIISLLSFTWFCLITGNLIQNVNNSQVVVLCYTLVAGLIASGAYSVSISKRDFLIFQISMLSTVIIGFNLNSSSLAYRVAGTLITVLFFVFLVVQRKNQSNAWHEKVLHNYELQKIIDTIPGGISVMRNGVYIHANEYLKNHILKKDISESLIGVRLGELSSEDSSFIKTISQFAVSQQSEVKFETPILVGNENRYHLVVAHNIFRTNSVDTVVATIDIQDLKTREIENNINLAKLEHSSKMAALGEMSSGLAHEINNPLAIISGRLQILKKQATNASLDMEAFLKSVDIIENTTFRIAKIVKGLKTFARDADNDDFSQGRMSDLIEDTLSFCEARFKNHGIILNYDAEVIKGYLIECRLTQLSQVLLNALNNSYDAIANLDEKWINLSIEKKGQKYIFRITDSGHGIPLAVRNKLMQPFFTTKEVGKGTGLGLSLSKSIVDAHNGRIYFNFDHPTNTQLVIEVPEFQSLKKVA